MEATEKFYQLCDEREPKPLEFSWVARSAFGTRKAGISLTPNPEKLYAYIAYASPLPEEMTGEERAALKSYINGGGEEYWYCGFGEFSLARAVVMKPNEHPSLTYMREFGTHHERETPLAITDEEAVTVIKNGRAIIYTGAGISVAAGTPDMKSLMTYLGIDRSRQVDDFARTIMFNPEGMRAKLISLQVSFFERATPAHISLARIQELTGIKIVTENLDMLGEAAGQEIVKRGQIDNNFPDEVLKQLDYIITVGLRADDSGLLWRFKQVNPEGRFIALNIEPPPYLDGTDYYLEGDVQVTLPRIEALLNSC